MNKKKNLTKRKINSLETKDKLLQSALTLFTKYGYDNVTVDEITQKAGVSKGSFYTHFPSKDYILVQEFAKIDNIYQDALNKLPKTATSSEKIKTMFNAMTKYCEDIAGIEFLRVVYINQISKKKTAQIINNRERNLYKLYKNIIQEGIDSGEFKFNLSLDYALELMIRICRSLLYDWCLYNGSFSIYTEGQRYISLVTKALCGEILEL